MVTSIKKDEIYILHYLERKNAPQKVKEAFNRVIGVPDQFALKSLIKATGVSIDCFRRQLSVRAYKCLVIDEYDTLYELSLATEAELMRIPNFGRTCLEEVKDLLARHGLCLGMGGDI